MAYNIPNLAFQKLIEKTRQFTKPNSSFQQGNYEKALRHDLLNSYDVEGDVNAYIFDADIPYYQVNQQFD